MLTDLELRALIRLVVHRIEAAAPDTVASLVQPLLEAGLVPSMHVRSNTQWSDRVVMEWYAGQILCIVKNQTWFAMTGLINTLDIHVPAVGNMDRINKINNLI